MKKVTGKEGESFAVRFLKNKRYRILESNYVTPIGEIDIIAKDGDTVVFIEVKTRKSLSYGYPFEAVTPRKREKLKRLAMYYLKFNRMTETPARFDVIGLYQDGGNYQVEHIIDAFEV